jgi:pimeloyl-ACP methyl ester carboxylesterase
MTTFVLLHGAYQGGWIWRDVASRLRAAGHLVYAPSLDGCGERSDGMRPGITTETHAAEVSSLLHYEDLNDVVLVSTSSGGMVMAKVAEMNAERVHRLVFADSLALMHGEKIRDIVTRPASVENDISLGPSREDAEGRLFKDLAPETRSWAAERCTLHPIGVFYQPVDLPKFWSMEWDADVLYCSQAPNPGEAHQKRAQQALNAKWHVFDTGHYPMLSMPDELTKLILRA